MKRKILVTLLAFCLIASLCVVGAAAAGAPCDGVDCDHEAAIGNVHYDTFEEAIEDAAEGNTVELLRDADSLSVTVDVGITIDLGGHTLSIIREDTTSTDPGISFTAGDSVLTNGTIVDDRLYVNTGGSSYNVTAGLRMVQIRGTGSALTTSNVTLQTYYPHTILNVFSYILYVVEGAELTVGSGTVIKDMPHPAFPNLQSTSGGVGIVVLGSSETTKLIVENGAEIETYAYAICGNGTADGTNIVINGGSITSTAGNVVYHPQVGTLTVNGGTLTGTSGIQFCGAGELNITGGHIIATAGPSQFPQKPADQNDGSTEDGAAVSIISRGGGYQGEGQTIRVNISGGTLTSRNNAAISVYRLQKNNGWVTNDSTTLSSFLENLEITDGTIESAEGRGALEVDSLATNDVEVYGGEYSASVAPYVTDGLSFEANFNGVYTYHRTIESAVEAAGAGGSVSMISDGVVVDKTTGHTITLIDGGSEITMTVTDDYVYTLPELDKNGYTFTGWRVNDSNTIVKGGDTYTVDNSVTFTAVWNMIMIPDTYDIAVDQPAHGTVDVSLSNASQGSVITVTATPDEGYELVYITVDGEPISGNSFVMPDHAVEVSALFAEIGKEVNFVDVSRADWFYDYVQYVAQNGLMEGTTRTAFEPNASMTRAMFWTVLARIDGETITGDAWKTLAQTWAVESGISDGTNADALITREQMVTMLYRYAGSPVAGGMAISEFTDSASVSGYATDAVTWALSEGILTGMGDGILAPQGTATRAQAAAMLMRFVEA